MTSIVIAAHNEAAVISGLLSALVKNSGDDFDIVVVCNGCSDNTADVARQFGAPVRVVETAIASKPNALNIGDEIAQGFPRVYIDGDILVDGDTIMKLSRELQRGEFLAAGVQPIMDTSGCSLGVQAYYSIKDRLPSSRQGIAGSGLYAVSEVGRRRFEKFPAIVSDDLFVRLLFKESERTTLPGLHSVVFAAKNVRQLMIQRTRSAFGSGEVSRRYPELLRNNAGENGRMLLSLFKNPLLWWKLFLYVYVAYWSKLMARKRAHYVWEREQTSRDRKVAIT